MDQIFACAVLLLFGGTNLFALWWSTREGEAPLMASAVYRDKNPTIFRWVQIMYAVFALTAFFGFWEFLIGLGD